MMEFKNTLYIVYQALGYYGLVIGVKNEEEERFVAYKVAKLWHKHLQHCEIESIQSALDHYATEHHDPPTLSDLMGSSYSIGEFKSLKREKEERLKRREKRLQQKEDRLSMTGKEIIQNLISEDEDD